MQLYLKNNPKLEHQVFIYSYCGIVDVSTNPFHYVSSALPYTAKKSIILQNLPSGEMMQAFITPFKKDGKTLYQIENTVIYGNKTGTLLEISLSGESISKSEKYRQFTAFAQSLLAQFN
ncbi:hypothetical protein [Wielerella bovis]|uniref:hypothetical protein n=1 Tax=Wielerella bovis TaxID=2917790 RepID=UPI0020198BF3|nr:hypothetical protein [Wielerella bovis]ULJ63460.1 hypothetical protein MIS46_05290 [Wielerella bovis]ULJ65628.1 hypothetical protein MIS33_05050 [Wielerella bovis]ULJ66328.1 hypothetical protein MIS31_08655 [Wielerella bovis]